MEAVLKALVQIVAALVALLLHAAVTIRNALLAPGPDDEEEQKRLERRRKESCYELVAFVLNTLGYLCRGWFTRQDLADFIEGGISPEDLLNLFLQKLDETEGIILGELPLGGEVTLPVKLTEEFRARHCYIVGKSGSGKTTLIRAMVLQDLDQGRGVGILAPEAELLEEEILPFLPEQRVQDVVYVNPGDTKRPLSLNPLYLDPHEDLHLKVDETTTILSRVIGEHGSGARMEEVLRQSLYALTQFEGATLLDVSRLLSRQDDGFRKEVLSHIHDPEAETFFRETYPSFPKDAHLPIVNRLGKLIRPAPVRAVLCAKGPSLSFRTIMDQGAILLCNLSDGLLGPSTAELLGQLIVAKIQLAAMSRADTPPPRRRQFQLYLDEFQAFAGTTARSYEVLLSRARKYRLGLVLAHQQTHQLPLPLLKEILGNVSTVICFGMGSEDAHRLSRELVGEMDGQMVPVEPDTLLGLNPGQAYMRIGKTVLPLRTFLVNELPRWDIKQAAIEASRKRALLPEPAEQVPTEHKPDGKDSELASDSPPVKAQERARQLTNLDREQRPEAEEPQPQKPVDDPYSWIDQVEPGHVWGGMDDTDNVNDKHDTTTNDDDERT